MNQPPKIGRPLRIPMSPARLPGTALMLLVALSLIGISSAELVAAIQSDDLNFASSDHNMWGGGKSSKMDETYDQLLFPFAKSGTLGTTFAGTGITMDYAYSGKAGLEAKLKIDSGTVNASYPLRVDAQLPKEVDTGAQFSIDTSNWAHLASSLTSAGPAARFTLDAILEFESTIGKGELSVVGFSKTIDPVPLSITPYRKTLIDIGSGASGVEIPAGQWGTVSIAVPEQLTTSDTTLGPPPEFRKLVASATGKDKFLNLNVDLDAVAQAAFGLPDVLEGDYQILADGNGDGKDDLSISYTLLNLAADLGLQFSQQFTLAPTGVNVTMTASTGEVRKGKLGDTFTFKAPDQSGKVTVDAEYVIDLQLRNQTGFVVNGSLQLQAGKFDFHEDNFTLLPDLDLNLAQELGLGSDYLIDQQIPDGGLSSAPVYLFDKTFAMDGVAPQTAQYTIMVVPEPTTWAIGLISLVVMASARRGLAESESP